MKSLKDNAALWMAVSLATAIDRMRRRWRRQSTTTPPPTTAYTLTVNTVDPTTGVGMTVAPARQQRRGQRQRELHAHL